MSRHAMHMHDGVALWSVGPRRAAVDVWFHPAFGDCHRSYRHAFESTLSRAARVWIFDPPGHGASPPRRYGLSIAGAARLWARLVERFTGTRPVVLVGHSMAGIIAVETAGLLARPPALVVSLEGNLTRADAYFSGSAARYANPLEFKAAICGAVARMARRQELLRDFAGHLRIADARTLWSLGRSVMTRAEPGRSLRRLRCPKIYYWDSMSVPRRVPAYLARHEIPERRLDGLGHWPMLKSPARFYATLAEDVRRLAVPND